MPCSTNLSIVVPANAGTHHRTCSLKNVSATEPKRDGTAYGSRRSPGRRGQLSARLHLRRRLLHQLAQLGADLALADGDALRGEIGDDLVHDAVGFIELGGYDLARVSERRVAAEAQLVRRPQSEQLVAAGLGLELLLLVERELLLIALLALVECRHGAVPISLRAACGALRRRRRAPR